MAITIPTISSNVTSFNVGTPVDTGAITLSSGQVLIVGAVFTDNNPAGTLSISDNVGGMTYTLIQDTGATGSRVAVWSAVTPNATSRTVSVGWDSGNNLTVALFWAAHSGADTATPIGSSSKGTAATSVSYNLTPATSGSALYLLASDGNGTGSTTMTAGANCTAAQTQNPDSFCAVLFRPTTQPRTDASAFTLAETHTGSGVNWVGFEVRAAGGGGSSPKRAMLLGVG